MSNTHTPLVTFFVPVYNTRPYVRECLDSILAQRGDYDYDILVIDDASPDNSGELVRDYLNDSRIHFIQHESNQGAIATWNEGFMQAQGRYIARIDSDDRVRPDFLTHTVPLLERYPHVGLVYGDIALIDERGRVTSERNNVNRGSQPGVGNELKAILKNNYIPAPTVLARREAWMLSVPMPGWLGFCDWYQTVQIARQWDFAYVDEVLADYRVHGGNMHSSMILDKTGEETTFRVLNEVFSDPNCGIDKAEKRDILAENYRHYGDSYFGVGMLSDARRCYARGLWNGCDWNPTFRRCLASCIPANAYQVIKGLLK